MQVKHVITESGSNITEVQLDFNELTSIQIGALRAISAGRLDFDNASDRMMDVIYELQHYNLLDRSMELTVTGNKAVGLADRLGGSAERRRAASKETTPDPEEVDNSDADYDTDYESDFTYDKGDLPEFNTNRLELSDYAI
jgi:hypothetical protein